MVTKKLIPSLRYWRPVRCVCFRLSHQISCVCAPVTIGGVPTCRRYRMSSGIRICRLCSVYVHGNTLGRYRGIAWCVRIIYLCIRVSKTSLCLTYGRSQAVCAPGSRFAYVRWIRLSSASVRTGITIPLISAVRWQCACIRTLAE
jgi:hypothetical protein